jgi:hypothetical protein
MDNHLSDYDLTGNVKSISSETKRGYSFLTDKPVHREYYEFNKAGFLIEQRNINLGFGWNSSKTYLFEYNDDNKVVKKTESYLHDSRDSSSRRNKITRYNSNGDLIEEKIVTDDELILDITTFKYDDQGNILESVREYLPCEEDAGSFQLNFNFFNPKKLSLSEFRAEYNKKLRNEKRKKEVKKYRVSSRKKNKTHLSKKEIVELKSAPIIGDVDDFKKDEELKDNNFNNNEETDDAYSLISFDYNDKPEDLFPKRNLIEKKIKDKNGNIIAREIFNKKDLVEKTYYTNEGVIYLKERFLMGLKGVYEYNENGTIKEAGVFNSKGKKTMYDEFIHNENDQLIEWSSRSSGGKCISVKKYTYYDNGIIKSLTENMGDKLPFQSKLINYDINGTIKERYEINNGRPQQRMKYFENGDISEHTIYYDIPNPHPMKIIKLDKDDNVLEVTHYSKNGTINSRVKNIYNTSKGKLVSKETITEEFDSLGKINNSTKKISQIRYFDSDNEWDNKFKEETTFDDKGNWIFKKIINKKGGKIISPEEVIVREIEYF